jgi:HEAT repeat protein
MLPPSVPSSQHYDFLSDLESDSAESVYVAVKALGFLPELAAKSTSRLSHVMEHSPDSRIRLEAAASLARLGYQGGWDSIAKIAGDRETAKEYRMEVALILAEIPDRRSAALLKALMEGTSNDPELRAAGAWGLAEVSTDAELADIVARVDDSDEVVAMHAILVLSRLIRPDNLDAVLRNVGDDSRRSAGLVRAVLLSRLDFVPDIVRLIRASSGQRRQWLLYVLACRGRAACGQYLITHSPDLLRELEFFWTHQVENWTNRLDAADQIEFLREQVLDDFAPSL